MGSVKLGRQDQTFINTSLSRVSHITILWSAMAAACVVLAIMHAVVWILDRRAFASLAFSVLAFGTAAIAWTELLLMMSRTAAEYGRWIQWLHVPIFFQFIGMLVFLRLYLGTGKAWLLWSVIALRSGILLANFVHGPNFSFAKLDSIERIGFLGEHVSIVGHAVAGRWQWVGTISAVLALWFMADASISMWRRGAPEEREKALVVGGGVWFFTFLSGLFTQLVVWGVLKWPTIIAPCFMVAVAAMAFEMSRDLLRASRLSRELRDSQRALDLAASAAGLGLWSWDSQTKRVWATDKARAMLGLDAVGVIDASQLARLIDDDDLPRVERTLSQAMKGETDLEVQFRTRTPHDSARWLLAHGRVECEANASHRIRGILRDVTEQRRVQEEMDELRVKVAHASRVTILGQLASTFAHELRQPLTAILANVTSAQLLLQSPQTDTQAFREIADDIYRDGRRAAEVIERLSAMLKRRPLEFQPVAVDGLLRDTIALVRIDAAMKGVSLERVIETESPVVRGHRVQLSQVLINLIVNAIDAVAGMPAPRRHVIVRVRATEDRFIEIAVSDRGAGIADEAAMRLFEPFFTTKSFGMGMGLSVSRDIIELHGGRLWAENNAEGGATFLFSLPLVSDSRLDQQTIPREA